VLLRCSDLIFLEARMVPAPVTAATMAALLVRHFLDLAEKWSHQGQTGADNPKV
jgi:hypothetical protein